MKITLRQKPLKDGNASLYLDYYDKGKREYEFLDLYLVPDNAPDARRLNTAAMQKATAIKAERTINPDGRHSRTDKNADGDKKNKTPRLTEWIQTVYEMKMKAGCSKHVLWNINHIKELVEEYLVFAKKHDPRIGRIEKSFLVSFLQYLQNDHTIAICKKSVRHLSAGSLKQYQLLLATILNVAVKEDIIARNPFGALSEKETLATPASTRTYLSIDEVKRFMEARCEKMNAAAEECKMAFVFSCFTGLRISDIRSLRWCDIQGINGIPHVRTTMVKTKKPIFVPLSMNAMLWMPKREDDTNDTALVFAKLPSTSASLNDHVRRVAKAAKIDKPISFHTSRHTFATLTLKASKDLYVVSKLLGHASINTTRVYAEVLDSTLEDAIIKQEGILETAASNAMSASASQ